MPKTANYIAITQAKMGELLALGGITPLQRGESITPLVEFRKHTSPIAVKYLAENWGTDDYFYLDCNAVPAAQFQRVVDELARESMKPIPVVLPDSSMAHLEIARELMSSCGDVACLRMTPKLTKTKDGAKRINFVLTELEVEASRIDLLLDFNHIFDVENHLENCVRALEFLPIAGWRTITIAASSFPKELGKCGNYEIVNGVSRLLLPRVEMETYRRLVEESGFDVRFADYTVTYAERADEVPQHFRPAANLRYTSPDGFLILRGEYHNGNEEMVRVSKALVSSPEFQGANFSMGDGSIYRCSKRKINPGGSPQWRQRDINHHIEMTIHQLANLSEP
jgi:hypothetical protein